MFTCVDQYKSVGVNYYLQPSGNPTVLSAWNTAPNGTGTNPSSFTSGDIWNIINDATLNSSWSFGVSSATVNVGDGTSSITFTLASGSSISGVLDYSLTVLSNATLDIESNFTFPTLTVPSFSTGSTVIFGANSPDIPYNLNFYNLIIDNTINLGSNSINVNNVMTINASKVFTMKGTLNLNGTFTGPGLLAGDLTQSDLNLNGTGAMGTIAFSIGSETITNLNMAASAPAVILGSDLIVDGGSPILTAGSIDLNGNDITFGNTSSPILTFGTMTFKGSAASILTMKTGLVSGSLLMDATLNTLKALVLDNGSGLTLGSPLNITDSLSVISGVLNISGTTVTLKATSSLKGRIGMIGGSGSITGNITVETFIPGSNTGWANLGINGVDNQTIGDWDTQIPMTCDGCVYSPGSIPGDFYSITGWNEGTADYDTTVTSGTALTPGKGFWVYVGSGATTTTDFVLSNTGLAVVGASTIPISRTSGTNSANDGFNLISNPYASPISWTAFRALPGNASIVNNAIHVWNADLSSGAGGVTSYVAGAASPGGTAIGDNIPAGQGFYVQATSSGSLTYNETIKTNANTGATPLLKTTASNDYGKLFKLKLKGPYDWDATVFRVHPDATPVFDRNWDAQKIFQSPGYAGYPGPYTKYTTISSKDPVNENYSIQSIPSLTQGVNIPVLVKVSSSGTYTISAIDSQNINDCVLLKDILLNITTDLKSANYIFTINDTTSAPRFELILCRDLYVDLVSVKELAQSNFININQDEQGAFVKTVFSENTKATISVYNIIGQKLAEDLKVEGMTTTTRLNLDLHNQVVLIRVVSDKEISTKKIVLH